MWGMQGILIQNISLAVRFSNVAPFRWVIITHSQLIITAVYTDHRSL